MKRPVLISLLGFCLTTLAPAEESVEAQIKSFQQTVSAALAKTASPPGDPRQECAAYTISSLSQFVANASNANPQELERTIASLVALVPNDSSVVKAGETLLETIKTERQARIASARVHMDALLKQAGEACLAAKVPADLDHMLATLAPYSRNFGNDRRLDDQESWQRGANAYRFLTRWQDYLGFLNRGGVKEAADVLRDLSGSVDVGIMPRSAILELLTPSPAASQNTTPDTDPLAAITAKLEQAKTLDDLIAVSRAFRVQTRPNQYQGAPLLQQIVNNLIDDRQQVLAGNRPANLFSDSSSNNRQLSARDLGYTQAAQVALFAFRRETQIAGIHLAFTGSSLPPATAEESPDAYLIRIVEKFVADNDWMQTRDALELYRTFSNTGRPPSWLTANIEACTAYLAARNLDLAGQYPAAIASYRRALRSTGRYVPVQAIGLRLAELKETTPQAFTDPAAEADLDTAPRNHPPANLPPGYGGPSLPGGASRPTAPTGPRVPTTASPVSTPSP